MGIPILKHSGYLIATMQDDVGDDDLAELMTDISEMVGRTRARGVILDVSELEVLDSYGTRTLRTIAHTTRLRGAATVIVGIQPEVAFAMVQLGLELDGIATALDLEAGMEQLRREIERQGAAA
jgi:rsbT antagonist protein RsbS